LVVSIAYFEYQCNANERIEQYALNEASFVVVKMLQRFDTIKALNKGPIRKGLSLTLFPLDGVQIKMHRANS
jgi:hypothetical protein